MLFNLQRDLNGHRIFHHIGRRVTLYTLIYVQGMWLAILTIATEAEFIKASCFYTIIFIVSTVRLAEP